MLYFPIEANMRIACATLLSTTLLFAASGVSQTTSPAAPTAAPENESPTQPGLQAQIARMFASGEYASIDRIADRARSEKTRLRGGIWSLKHIYNGLSMPPADGYEASIARLKAWIAQNPHSVTAHVALGEVYYRYSWVARGDGYADTITPEARQLFLSRIAEAKAALDEASTLKMNCPEWYSVMLSIARSEGWDNPKTAEIFNKAVAYEPAYFYYYDGYADYLLPMWAGKPGQSAAFAKQSADQIGGQQGDFVYFEIAAHIIGDMDLDPQQLDWPRVQRGHQALEQMYGAVNYDRNQFALLAWRFKDAAVARQQFTLIGDKWGRTIWQDGAQFAEAKNWSAQQPVAISPAPPTH